MERDVGEGNLATAAASALAAAAVKAKVPSASIFASVHFSFVLKIFLLHSEALGCGGREEDQISGGFTGGDPDEEAGDQIAAL